MKTVLVMEHMAKRERTLPTHPWRVVERNIIEKPDGRSKMLRADWSLIGKDLTLSKALHILEDERVKRIIDQPPIREANRAIL